MTKDETLRLALEALKKSVKFVSGSHDPVGSELDDINEAITAIKAALEAKDEPMAHSVVAGALFDFMGWLTSREKRLILSSVDEASPAVEAITEFAKKRNLSLKYAEVGYWMEFLSTPPQLEAKDEPVAWAPYLSDRADGVQGHYAIARWNPRGYREVWNLRRHTWGAFSDDVMSLEEADYLLQQITIPTRKPTPPAQPVIDESSAKRIATALGWEPKRTWVALTDDEIDYLVETEDWFNDPSDFAKIVQSKLKDKNI